MCDCLHTVSMNLQQSYVHQEGPCDFSRPPELFCAVCTGVCRHIKLCKNRCELVHYCSKLCRKKDQPRHIMQCSREALQLTVLPLRGDAIHVIMLPSALIIDLKNLVIVWVASNQSTSKNDIDFGINLVHEGKVLPDDATLCDAGLVSDDKVALMEQDLLLTVRLLSGVAMPVMGPGSVCIGDLKDSVTEWAFSHISGICPENCLIKLVHDSKLLPDDATLHDMGVVSGDEITVIYQLVDTDSSSSLPSLRYDSSEPSQGDVDDDAESDASDWQVCRNMFR